MATLTPRLALRKPGGGDNVTVLTDLDNNYDILDRAVLVIAGTERINISGGIDVTGSVSGYSGGQIRYDPNGIVNGAEHVVSTNSPGATRMSFHHRANANTGDWSWANGTGAGTARMTLDATGKLGLPTATTATTVGAAGAASAMPTPVGYMTMSIGGTDRKIAYFNV